MKAWRVYLRILGSFLLVLTVVATYRDFASEPANASRAIQRLILMPAIGIGLIRRNRWVVQLAFAAAIPTAMILWIGSILLGPILAASEFALLSTVLTAFGILVFVPRAILTGWTPFRNRSVSASTDQFPNPYQPPSTIDDGRC